MIIIAEGAQPAKKTHNAVMPTTMIYVLHEVCMKLNALVRSYYAFN